jgi:ElaB/YqjD/DUF883 family membrane-anchored ribosome-binding protein
MSTPTTESDATAPVDSAATERSPEQIEAEIEATREELGETVAALADRTDVKKQAKRKAAEARQAVREDPARFAAIGALAGGFLIGWILLRRR